MSVNRVLVANRGEIASRVFRTCREMGIGTVAVYSDEDADAPFVHEADVAVRLPGSRPADTYLRSDLILEAAARTGADAIHPGYGFLSENADFATAVESAGRTFIGPPAAAINAMGDKLRSKELMESSGVPVLRSVKVGDDVDDEVAKRVEEIGYPVLVKASAGGGGRGMRIVEQPDALAEAVASARHEAASAFGDDTVFVEKYVVRPRHIEVQVMADGHDNVVALFERECSIQRRHQKVIEESPSSAVDEDLRRRLCDAAVAAARAVDYRGAGTVEFVLAADGTFAFLEMNTRLQVEHPVTELVTGLDLVRLQIDVAAGRPLPPAALSPTITGHAIEARLYAEDVPAGYLPTTGTVSTFEIDAPTGVRIDTSIAAGSVLSSQYDAMLAKVIAWAPSRDESAQLLARSLRRSRVGGVTTNLALLVNVLEDEDFRAGRFSTAFLDEKRSEMHAPLVEPEERTAAVVAAALADAAANRASATVQCSIPSGWRNNRAADQRRQFRCEGETIEVAYRDAESPSSRVVVGDVEHAVLIHTCTPDLVDVAIDGVRRRFGLLSSPTDVTVFTPRGPVVLDRVPRFPETGSAAARGGLIAPMPGSVLKVLAEVGDEVVEGAPVAVLEAMKMEHTVVAPEPGTVAEVLVTAGDQVEAGAMLARIEPAESP